MKKGNRFISELINPLRKECRKITGKRGRSKLPPTAKKEVQRYKPTNF